MVYSSSLYQLNKRLGLNSDLTNESITLSLKLCWSNQTNFATSYFQIFSVFLASAMVLQTDSSCSFWFYIYIRWESETAEIRSTRTQLAVEIFNLCIVQFHEHNLSVPSTASSTKVFRLSKTYVNKKMILSVWYSVTNLIKTFVCFHYLPNLQNTFTVVLIPICMGNLIKKYILVVINIILIIK